MGKSDKESHVLSSGEPPHFVTNDPCLLFSFPTRGVSHKEKVITEILNNWGSVIWLMCTAVRCAVCNVVR